MGGKVMEEQARNFAMFCNYMQIVNNFQAMRVKGIIFNEEESLLYTRVCRFISGMVPPNDLPKGDSEQDA